MANPRNSIPELAPSWLPRQQRRRIDRELHKLLHRGTCSICSSPLKHNSRTASGLDANGNVVVAGECCISQVVKPFGLGFYSGRKYDFLQLGDAKSNTQPTSKQIADAITLYQKAIAEADKGLDGVERRGGSIRASEVVLLDHPWKDDDRAWFQRNPTRSHRARMPFPGEVDEMVAVTQSGRALVMLVRQVKPGARMRGACDLSADLLPLPDDETVLHALFDLATQHKGGSREALDVLIEKYKMQELGQ